MSKISFCNGSLAKELFKRNWYISGLYLMGWLLLLVPVISHMRSFSYWYENASAGLSGLLPGFLTFSAFLALTYCVVSVCANCDYLFKPESARFYGASAQPRSTLLLTGFINTLLPGLLVNIIAGSLVLFAEASAGYSACIGGSLIASGCLLVVIQSGLCLLCASLTSSRLMFIILVLMLHGYAFVLDSGFKVATNMFSYGTSTNLDQSGIILALSPMAQLEASFFMGDEFWKWLGVYAIAAVVAVVASCFIFKYRHVETVGEGIAFKKLRPVFSIAFSFAFGLGFSLVGCFFFGNSGSYAEQGNLGETLTLFVVSFLLGALGSYAVLECILAKSTNIIAKRLPGMALLSALCLCSCLGAFQFGSHETTYVPDASNVEKVSITGIDFVAMDSNSIQAAIDLHQAIIDEHSGKTASSNSAIQGNANTSSYPASAYEDDSSRIVTLEFAYLLDNGTIVTRMYSITMNRSDLANPSSCTSKAVALAGARQTRQNRVDWLYDLANNHPTSNAATISFFYSEEISPDDLKSDITMKGEAFKELLDACLADEILNSTAFDPDITKWAAGINSDESYSTVVAYVYPELYSSYSQNQYESQSAYQILAAIYLSFEETPQTLAWISEQYHLDLT